MQEAQEREIAVGQHASEEAASGILAQATVQAVDSHVRARLVKLRWRFAAYAALTSRGDAASGGVRRPSLAARSQNTTLLDQARLLSVM